VTLTYSPDHSSAIRRLVVINSIIGVTTAGISTRIFVISAPTLAAALDTDMLGISWALIVYQMAGGLRASMGYCGCETIEDMRNKAEFVQITAAGMRESHVHDVQITKEAPNYRSE